MADKWAYAVRKLKDGWGLYKVYFKVGNLKGRLVAAYATEQEAESIAQAAYKETQDVDPDQEAA